jgi:hypothetical protein
VSFERSSNFLEHLAWAALERAPHRADAVIRFIRAQVLPRLELRLPIYRLSGQTRTGLQASAIFAGHWDDRDFLVNRFFEGPFARVRLGSTSVYALPSALRRLRSDADLTIARVSRRLVLPVFGREHLCVPEAVDCEIVLSATPPALPLATKTAKHNAKIVRDNELTWSVSHDLRDCDAFIATMYEPYLAARHGTRGIRKEPYRVRRQFRQGALLLVHHRGEPVAGGTLMVDASVLRSGVLGTADGGKNLLKLGVVSALYLFGAEYARQLGLDRFNLGASNPSLADGVLVHKFAWGGRVVDRNESFRDYVLGWSEPTAAVVELLAHTPLIFRDAEGLSVLAAVTPPAEEAREGTSSEPANRDGPVAPDLARLSKQAAAAGLRRVIVLGDGSRLPAGVWAVQRVAAERIRAAAYPLEATRR